MMHHTEQEFRRATLRELLQRWEIYAECRGWKEPVAEVQDVVE